MVRKAEQFRRRAERTVPKRASAPPRPRRDRPVDTSQPGVSATDRKVGKNATAMRNRSRAAQKKASWMLEDSTTDRPSRKSTRRAETRVKPDSNLRRREIRKTAAPKARATRSAVQRTKATATTPRRSVKARPSRARASR